MGGRDNGRMDPRHGDRMDASAGARVDEREDLPVDAPGGGRSERGGGQRDEPGGERMNERDGGGTNERDDELLDGGDGGRTGERAAMRTDGRHGGRMDKFGGARKGDEPGGGREDEPDGFGGDEREDDWKQDALEDFRQWLDALEEAPPADEASESPDCDLHDLFAEFAALRQEVRLQNREQSRAGRELVKAAAMYETAARLAQRRDEDMAALDHRVSRAAEDRCLRSVLEIRDALVRGREAAVQLRDRPRGLFRRPSPGIAGVAEGYELALSRFDRVLSGYGVQLVQTVGQPFDSRTMHAVEARRVERSEDGMVVEELRSGFTRDGEVLRLADVAVNRRRPDVKQPARAKRLTRQSA